MLWSIIGGAIIGVAVSLMLVFNGRVAGISGILSGILTPKRGDLDWRLLFVAGLFTGGTLLNWLQPELLQSNAGRMNLSDYALAGLFVGFGTLLGNGCTSGHGVCGISRLSVRSMIATLIFISFGILSVLMFKALKGGL